MKSFTKVILLIAVLAAVVLSQPKACAASCQKNCNAQGICVRCSNDKTPSSDCNCAIGQYNKGGQCTSCPELCSECEVDPAKPDGIICTACKEGPGLALNLQKKECECDVNNFIDTGSNSPTSKCQQCYIYGNKCLTTCPSGTKANKDVMICEISKKKDVENDDQIHIIIVAVIIILVQLLLSIALYNYLYTKLKEAYAKDQNSAHELTPEERAYLANQGDYEREIALREEQDRKSRSKVSQEQSEVIE